MRQFAFVIFFMALLPGCALQKLIAPEATTAPSEQATVATSDATQTTTSQPEAQPTESTTKTNKNNNEATPEQTAQSDHQKNDDPQTETNVSELTITTEAQSGATDEQNSVDETQAAVDTNNNESSENPQSEEKSPGISIDIWDRIRKGFALQELQHKRIDQQFKWFASQQDYLDRVVERAQPYMHHIVEQLEANNIPLEIALLPIVESAFQPFAYSHGRASGIWQFIPSTGKRFGLKQNWWYDGRRDVYASTDAAIRLLKALHTEFDGDWMLALAAYNSGSGNVQRAIRYNKKRKRPTDFFSLRLPKETQYYVPKLLALKKLIADPKKYNVELDSIKDEPYLKQVKLDSQIDLALAAELANVELDELYRLNPGFNRWATSPSGPFDLLVPLANAETFEKNLQEYPPEKRIRWIRHTIKQGETISTIARKYQISTDTIKRVNRLRSNRLRAGHGLTIPVASKKLSSYTLSANQRKSRQQNINRAGHKITYIVQPGDTLWDLARRHKIGVRQLAKWNSMAPRDPLTVGQRLIIWSRDQSAESAYEDDPIHIATPPTRTVTQRIGYRVRRGDSLALIASKFRVSVSQLLRWNKRVNKTKYLQPGQRIVLYVDVTRTSS